MLRSRTDAYGYSAILRTAIPLAATVGCFSITLFTDRTLLMWFDPTASAASMSAGNVYWATVCIPITAIGYVTPLIAAEMGKRRSRGRSVAETWSLVWQTVWITLTCLPFFVFVALIGPTLFRLAGHADDLATQEGQYLSLLLLVAPASMLEAGLTGFLVGRRITSPILKANITASVANVLFDAWFIFGGLGIPAGGILGAAAATALSMWLKVMLFAIILTRIQSFRRHLPVAFRPDWSRMRAIMLPGSTLGIQQLIRSSLMSLLLVWIGAETVTGLAATTATLSLYQLLSIPAIGLATAITVVVGQVVAQKRPAKTRLAVQRCLVIAGLMAVIVCATLGVFHNVLLDIPFGRAERTDESGLREQARTLMQLCAVYAVFDVLALSIGAVLKGLGKTSVILLATALPGVLTLPLSRFSASSTADNTVHYWMTLLAWSFLQFSILIMLVWQIGRQPHS